VSRTTYSKTLALLFSFGVVLSLGAIPINSANLVENELPFILPKAPVQYKNIFYGITDAREFKKFTNDGREKWTRKNKVPRGTKAILKFGNLFLLFPKGRLEKLNSEYGYQLWAINSPKIQNLKLSYPFIFYQNKRGQVGALDFFSGNPIWRTKGRRDPSILVHPQKSWMASFKEKKLFFQDPFSGALQKTAIAPEPIQSIKKGYKETLIIHGKSKVYVLDIPKKKFSSLKISSLSQTKVIDKFYLNSFNESKRTLSKWNLKTMKRIWNVSLGKKIKNPTFYLGKKYLMVVNQNKKFQAWHLKTGKKAVRWTQLPFQADQKIIECADIDNGDIRIFTKGSWVEIIPK